MKDWMRIWISGDCMLEGIEDKLIVIPGRNDIGYDRSIIEIQNGTEIKLVNSSAFIPLEFGYIGCPFLVWFLRIEVS